MTEIHSFILFMRYQENHILEKASSIPQAPANVAILNPLVSDVGLLLNIGSLQTWKQLRLPASIIALSLNFTMLTHGKTHDNSERNPEDNHHNVNETREC